MNGNTLAANAIVDGRDPGLRLDAGFVSSPRVSELEKEELLENQTLLWRSPKRIQFVDRCLIGREVRLLHRHTPRHETKSISQSARQRFEDVRRQLIERLPHDAALHVGCHRSRLLVERDDARSPDAGEILGDQLVLRIHEVKTGRIELHVAKHHNLQVRFQNVGEECLIHPGAANRSAGIGDHRMEDAKAPSSSD